MLQYTKTCIVNAGLFRIDNASVDVVAITLSVLQFGMESRCGLSTVNAPKIML